MRNWIVWLLAALLLAWWWHEPETSWPGGVLAPAAPRQALVERAASIAYEGYQLTPRANFSLTARVLSKRRYRLGWESELSPLDLALGWGEMSDSAVLEQVQIRQSGRWYFTRFELPPPIPVNRIMGQSGNMHMVPADNHIRKQLLGLHQGSLIELHGRLVDVDSSDGRYWRTSLSREDTGAGACEIVLVEQVIVLPGPA